MICWAKRVRDQDLLRTRFHRTSSMRLVTSAVKRTPLTAAHVRRYHQHYHTSWHVWQGRFRSSPIQEDGRLLTVHRSIEPNPVRVGLVERAEDWQWSSASRKPARARPLAGASSCPVSGVCEPAADGGRGGTPTRALQCRRPYGDAAWTVKTAQRMDLEAGLRPRGRPRKNQGPESSLFGEEESAGGNVPFRLFFAQPCERATLRVCYNRFETGVHRAVSVRPIPCR
jgi:hypothetical protein